MVITYSGVHYEITPEQEQSLRLKGISDEVEIDGNIVKMKNISDILMMSKYYDTFPDKRPVEVSKPCALPEWKPFTRDRRIRALEQIKFGLKNYISSPRKKITGKPEGILESVEKSLAEAKAFSGHKLFSNPVKEFWVE